MIRLQRILPRLRGFLHGLRYSHSSKNSIIYNQILFRGKRIIVGERAIIFKSCRIECVDNYRGDTFRPEIIIGNNVSIQQNCHITCAERIDIGHNTAIAAGVTITDIDHPYEDISIPIEQQPLSHNPVTIGPECKIYNHAVILPGTTIGKHCVIGANSVVKGNIPDYSVAVGMPARIVKRYNFTSRKWEKTNPDGTFIDD